MCFKVPPGIYNISSDSFFSFTLLKKINIIVIKVYNIINLIFKVNLIILTPV